MIIEKFENFVDEYIEISREGIELILQEVIRFGRLIFGSVLVVLFFPFWLVGKRERSKRAEEFAAQWPELNSALEALSSFLRKF